MKLLIVEDSINIRESLRKFISHIEGITIVGEAEDEEYAIELVIKNLPDIIVLDIDLKEGNGFNVLKKVKEMSSSIIVAIFSNYAANSYRERALKENADYFFDKNLELDMLIDILKKLALKS
jgi:DNA-binding NarL/FixJ family response regulator